MRPSPGVISLVWKLLHCYATFPFKSGFRAKWLCLMCAIPISCYVFVCPVAILVVLVDESTRTVAYRRTKADNKQLRECNRMLKYNTQIQFVPYIRETVAVCENHTEHTNTLCGQNAEFCNIYKSSSCLTGNTLRLRYRAQPVNAVYLSYGI
jgi:hypothetical protein